MSRAERKNWLLGLCVAAAGVLAYLNGFAGQFLFDDREAILGNNTIRHLANWRAVLHPPGGGLTVTGRPGLNLSLALNWAWSGAQVWSYHGFNVVGHVLAGWVLFALARRTFQRVELLRDAAAELGFAVALLWVLHPLQTESVTYIVQRAEMLMGLCYLGTLLCFVRLAEAEAKNRSRAAAGWGGAAVLVCAAGMTCKEVMVSAPIIVLLYDRTFCSGTFRAALVRRPWLWAGLAATWLVLVAGGVFSSHSRGGTAGFDVGIPFWKYWLTQGPSIVRYLELTVWPHPLVLDYGVRHPWIDAPWGTMPANLLIGGWAIAVFGLLYRAPRWGFLGFWFFCILAPTSLVPGNRQTLAEHRMYLALAPLIAAAVAAIGLAVRSRAGLRRGAAAFLLIIAAAFGAVTHARNQDYGSEELIWRQTLARVPDNPYAHSNLGAVLYLAGKIPEAQAQFEQAVALDSHYAAGESNLGMTLQDQGKLDEAIRHYERALEVNPAYPQAANNLGVAFAAQGRWAEAKTAYERALRTAAIYPDALANLGVAERSLGLFPAGEEHLRRALALEPDRAQSRYDLGLTLRFEHRYADAEAELARAVKLRPAFPEAELNWGLVLLLEGQTERALQHINQAIQLNPRYADAYLNRGIVLSSQGQVDAAVADYRTALRYAPALGAAWANLGNTELSRHQAAEAVMSLKEAARLSPDDAHVHYDYSLALAAAGDREAAAAEIAESLRLDPGFPEAHNNLAVSLAAQGKLPEACAELVRLIQQHPDFAQAHQNLGLLYQAMGRTADAQRELKRAVQLSGAARK